jgi:large subunit ribosomal protein L28e
MAAIHSPALQWQLIRNNNSYLVKRDGHIFSAEPSNVTNLHSFKFSGLANNNTVAVNSQQYKSKDGKAAQRIVLTTRRQSSAQSQRLSRGNINTVLARNVRAHRSRASRVIEAATTRSFYRRDLTRYAIARYHALNRAAALKSKPAATKLNRRQQAKVAKKKADKTTA